MSLRWPEAITRDTKAAGDFPRPFLFLAVSLLSITRRNEITDDFGDVP